MLSHNVDSFARILDVVLFVVFLCFGFISILLFY